MFILQENFQSVDLENAANSCLANLPGVEQLELLRSLVEIVAQRYAISPLLDLDNLLALGNAQASLALRSLNRRFLPIWSRA